MPQPRLVRLATFALLLVAALALGGAAPHGTGTEINPLVARWIADHPGERVPVIAGVAGPLDDVTAFIEARGGAVEHELTLINAVSGTMPADAVSALASRDDVAYITVDAPVRTTATGFSIQTDKFEPTFMRSTKATDVWDKGKGAGIGVAIIDTGVSSDATCEFADPASGACGTRLLAGTATQGGQKPTRDGFGHGTHIANTVAGYAFLANGRYGGMAPLANIIPVKIDDDQGNSSVGDVIGGLGWVLANKDAYNIRVVNLSLSSTIAQSYKTDPLDAAVELLWFNGITVVVAAGNTPDAYSYSPANDPFVITVGAVDEHGTDDTNKHDVAPWSSRGTTTDGVSKPDVYAPGVKIIAGISPSSMIATVFPGGIVSTDNNQARYAMSGTSMATAVVSGGAALIAERHPDWTPGQIKQAMATMSKVLPQSPFARELQVKPAAELKSTPDASFGIVPNYLLLDAAGTCDTTVTNPNDCPVVFDKISWGSVDFQKISWSKISWSKISWSKISWSGVDFQKISWSKISWGSVLQ